MLDDRSPSHDDRLARLEADVLRLTELADRSPEREPIAGLPRQPRPAKAYHRDGESYPSAPCTVYPIIFLDSTFTETEGDESRSDTDRQAHGEELAFYDGEYLEEDTIVEVYRDNGRWWIARGGGVTLRWGKLDGDLAAGGTQTVSLWQKTDGGWDGWDEDSTENWTNVYAPPILPSGSLDSGNWVLVGEVNGRRVVLLTEC